VPVEPFRSSRTVASKQVVSEPRAYQWDYEPSPLTQESGFLTLSVGVFQWLPKARGKGLKKSKSIRVAGYMAEPERVYDKAQELCDRFNAAGVRAENPPTWVQKQYSVPRPFDMVVERSDELTSGQVRQVRLRVMRQALAPHGFVRGDNGTYVRRREGQIHLIVFDASSRGHKYDVNLGFHYDFVPPFFHKTRIPLVEYDFLDCAVEQRIGYFLPENRDAWFPYGNDRASLESTLKQNVRDCLAVFEDVSRRWADPSWWLTERTEESVRPWCRPQEEFHLFTACIALHLGHRRYAEDKLRELVREAPSAYYRQWYESLLQIARKRSDS
jgi:hypothetical protein